MADFDFSDLDTKPKLDFSDLNTTSEKKKGLPSFPERILPAIGQVAEDIGSSAMAVPGIIGRAIGAVPDLYQAAKKDVPESLSQVVHQPGRALTNVGMGIAKFAAMPAEIPGGVANYLAHIGLIEPESAEAFSKTILPNGIKLRPQYQQMEDNPQPGDVGLQVLGGIAPILPEAPAMLRGVASIATQPVKAVKNTLGDLNKIRGAREAEKTLEKVEGAYGESKQGLDEAERAHDINKSESYVDTGKSAPPQLERHINEMQKNVSDLEGQLTTVPEIAKSPEQSSSHLANAALLDQQATQDLSNAENAIGEHLNVGASHDERAAKAIKGHQEEVRKGISNQYDELEESLAGKTIETDHAADIAEKTQDLIGLIQKNEAHTPEALGLLKQLEKLQKGPLEVPANEYLTALRSAKDYAREARSMAYKHGVNAEERAAWEKRYNELDEKIDKMNDALEKGIGAEDSKKLAAANKAWREKVIPLYKNPTYQKIYHEEKIEGNIMKKLRGTGPGDVLMRNIIKNDPELLKNVVGQQYAEKPDLLHKKNEVTEEYTQKMPELERLKEQHNKAKENAAAAREGLKKSTENHQKVTKAYEAHQKLMEEKKALELKIDIAKKHLEKLTESAKKKGIKLEEKMKLEMQKKKYQKILNDKKDALSRTKKRAAIVLPAWLAKKYYFNGSTKE